MHHPRTLQRPPVRRPSPPAVKEGFDWGAAGWAGLAAGGAFVLLQTFTGVVFGGGGRTEAVRRLASVALGETVVSEGEPLSALIFFAAAAVHIPLSLIYARALAAMIHGMAMPRALPSGALFGAVLYLLNYHLISGFFPWFVSARGGAAFAAHLVFGLLAAGIYTASTRRGREPRTP